MVVLGHAQDAGCARIKSGIGLGRADAEDGDVEVDVGSDVFGGDGRGGEALGESEAGAVPGGNRPLAPSRSALGTSTSTGRCGARRAAHG